MEPTIAFNAVLLSEDAQISMLGIGTLAEVLKEAKELVQTPGEQFRRSMDLYDPSTQDWACYGEPEYNWCPEKQSGDLNRAQAYVVALKAALKALNRETRQVHCIRPAKYTVDLG